MALARILLLTTCVVGQPMIRLSQVRIARLFYLVWAVLAEKLPKHHTTTLAGRPLH